MTSIKRFVGCVILTSATALAQAQVVAIATNPQGSSMNSVGTALAGVMQQKAHLVPRIQPMSGTSAYMPLINRGEVEFGMVSVLDAVDSYQGTGSFKGRKNPDVRLVGAVYSIPIGIAVPNDSPVKSIQDLKGKRMPSQFSAQTGMRIQQNTMLGSAGLSTDDMKQYPVVNYQKGMEALGEDKVDAAMFCLGCGTAQEVNVQLSSRGGLRFLPISDAPEARAAMKKLFSSAYLQEFQPSPAATGVLVPTKLMVYSGMFVTNKSVPDDVVYKATKAIYESKPTLAAATPFLKSFEPDKMAEANPVPYHPGAEKFFKEVGHWPPVER